MRLVNQNDMGPKALVRGLQDLSKMSKNMFIASKFPKGCTVQGSPKQWRLGFLFWSRRWSFQRPNQVSYAYKHGQASSYQVSRHSAQNCTVKTLNCTTVNCRGKMVIWQSEVKIFGQHLMLKPQTSSDQFLIMILKAWLKKVSRCKSFYFWTAEKANCKLTRA